MNKAIVCVLLVALVAVGSGEARPKRSVLYAAAVAPVVATVPVVQSHHVVHQNPTTVVKTEQVRSGDHASYSYSSEVKAEPVVHTHTHAAVAAAPVAATAVVAAAPTAVVASHQTVHHTAAAYHPAAAYYYPAATSYYSGYYPAVAHYSHYSPYSYVVGK